MQVLVCWTGSQQVAVLDHNMRNLMQPILLADVMARVVLFGEHSTKALWKHVGNPQDEDPLGQGDSQQ